MVSFAGKNILYNGHELTFMHEIRQVLEIADGCLVLIKGSPNGPKRNVFFIDQSGHVKWQIQNMPGVDEENAWSYGGLLLCDGAAWAYNKVGFDCRIDLETGAITDRVFVK